MIAGARGVAIAIALAIVLGAIALVDARRTTRAPVDRALIPKFAATRLAWDGGETLILDSAGWHAESGAMLELEAVDAIVATLRGARWQRMADREAAGAIGPTLHVGEHTTLAVGQPLATTEQVWIVRDGTALLVDGWVARAIDVKPWQLHLQRPFRDADTGDLTLVEGSRTIELAGHRTGGKFVDPMLRAQLDDALRDIALAGPGTTASTTTLSQSVTLIHGAGRKTLVELGPCAGHPDQIAVAGTVDGCIVEAPWRTIQAIATALDGPDGVDLRPLPFAATGIRFPDGELVLGKPPHVTLGDGGTTTTAVEPGEVTALLLALTTRGSRAEIPTGAPHTLVIHTGNGDITLHVHAPDVVLRQDDRVAIRVAPAAYKLLARGARSYRVRTLWAEDPTTISQLDVDGRSYTRGVVIGEWLAKPHVAAVPMADVEAYVTAFAHPRALDADPPATFAVAHRASIALATPDGRSEVHTLELGAPTVLGCPARLGGERVLLRRELCSPPTD